MMNPTIDYTWPPNEVIIIIVIIMVTMIDDVTVAS